MNKVLLVEDFGECLIPTPRFRSLHQRDVIAMISWRSVVKFDVAGRFNCARTLMALRALLKVSSVHDADIRHSYHECEIIMYFTVEGVWLRLAHPEPNLYIGPK